MENAAKALIIAGGVLIGIIIASIFTYEMMHMSENARVYHEQLELTQITEFNSQFQKYAGKELRAQDVVTIYNYVNEWNKNSGETIDIETNDKTKTNINEIIFNDVLNSSDNIEGFISYSYYLKDGKYFEKKYNCKIISYNTDSRTH